MSGQHDDLTIGQYHPQPVSCHPWDPRAVEVARVTGEIIRNRLPSVSVEHIGSTAVPGCAGKGVIDLLLQYASNQLSPVRDALDDIGFQHQGGRHPWPEERPMRVGSLDFDSTQFQLHLHVVALDDPEGHQLLRFRDELRADPQLVAGYVAAKQAALAVGQAEGRVYESGDALEYVEAKQPFIQKLLERKIENSGN